MSDRYTWYNSLKHGGMLIAPSRLASAECFPDEVTPLPGYQAERLRRDWVRLETGGAGAGAEFISTVLEEVCGLKDHTCGTWTRGNDVDGKWSRRSLTGEMLKPRRLWDGPNGAVLPVFVDTEKRLGIGRGRRMASRVVEWLRATGLKVALLTNHRQWRLVYAGLDHEAWSEWDTDLWFEEGKPGLQVDALRALISPQALVPASEGSDSPLLTAILDSRKGEAELSATLGERVRQAVEKLIQAHAASLRNLEGVDPRDIYRAAVRIIMRLVVIMFAEARDLLPRENPIYHKSYGLDGLREELDRFRGAAADRLKHRESAWPRILGLFRLVYHGSPHELLPILRYGGGLFTPGDTASSDPLLRAVAAFETTEHAPNDAIVRAILDLLSRTKVKVRQGRGATWVEAPVDFSDLSSEYIGILYEGLLDFELRQADEPIIFLNLGDEPALPLARLEGMSDAALADLVAKFKVSGKKEDAGEDAEEEAEEADAEETDTVTEDIGEVAEEDAVLVDDDAHHATRERALVWARKAVIAGKMVPRPRGSRADAQREYEAAVDRAAEFLVKRIVMAEEWYLVRWGGTRKGAGTFYTRPQLAVPTVVRTLLPLACIPPADADGGSDFPTATNPIPPALWLPKQPVEILSLKVCDPAMGSGSFLVAALRYLTDTLYRSLLYHGWLEEGDGTFKVTLAPDARPPWFAECVKNLPVDHPDAEGFIRARLKRVVVERCLYGVDIDPLAVELGRLSLWVETMDRDLPFEFLDHKLKCGNSLVGCWFDQFRDYPLLAWEREGGDKGHKGVHCADGAWTLAIKNLRTGDVKSQMVQALTGQTTLFAAEESSTPEAVHDEEVDVYRTMHELPIHTPEEREAYYRAFILDHDGFQRLHQAFDAWCAVWFWPADELAEAPLPLTLGKVSDDARAVVARLVREHHFFHWELEFPDVFAKAGDGFDAVIGNPPWENLQANPAEFFSSRDPLFRTYGRLQGQEIISNLFLQDSAFEKEWLHYCESFKAYANWFRNAYSPFGDGSEGGEVFSLGRGGDILHGSWRSKRQRRIGYADPNHCYRHQSGGRIFTYKPFLELAYTLLRQGGQFGMIVPSSLYTDRGSVGLRTQFLSHGVWQWLFGFENRNGIFPDIDGRFKFCVVIIQKGGQTNAIHTAFMRRDLKDWEEAERLCVPYSHSQIERFSPNLLILLEICSYSDFQLLEKIYNGNGLLKADSPTAWGITYSIEYMMNTDAKLFPPLEKWKAQGYRPDVYSRWINQNGDVALPLYEGRMIGQFDFSQKGWVSGKGRTAVWRDIGWEEKVVEPQYLMGQDILSSSGKGHLGPKIAYMRIGSATNSRTVFSTYLRNVPAGDSVFFFHSPADSIIDCLLISSIFNAFAFDYQIRARLGGLNLSEFVMAEATLPLRSKVEPVIDLLIRIACSLMLPNIVFAPDWLCVSSILFDNGAYSIPWQRLWAITSHERLRLRCMMDAIIAELYGLEWGELAWVLRDCDHPTEKTTNMAFTRLLDPKGFWRIDKGQEPELRHTVLTLAALRDLKDAITAHGGDRDAGIAAFCAAHDGDGWMLPETLRLTDLGLGHDARAQEPQPVASRLGPRFLPWQLEQTVEESWAECEHHARTLLGEAGFRQLQAELRGETASPPAPQPDATGIFTNLFGEPVETDLFGDPVQKKRQPKKPVPPPVTPEIPLQPMPMPTPILPYREDPKVFPWCHGREEFLYHVMPVLPTRREGESFEFYLHAALLATRPQRLRDLLPVDTHAQFDGCTEAIRFSCAFPPEQHIRPRQIRRELWKDGYILEIGEDTDIMRLAEGHPPLKQMSEEQEILLTFALEAADELRKMLREAEGRSQPQHAMAQSVLTDFQQLSV